MDLIKKNWAVFKDSDLENEYRLNEYITQASVYRKVLLITIIASMVLFVSDINFFGSEPFLLYLFIARISHAIYCVIVYFILKNKLTLKQYDRLIIIWIISMIIMLLFVNFTRPSDYIGFMVLDAILIVFAFQLLGLKVSYLLIFTLSFTFLEFAGINIFKDLSNQPNLFIYYVTFVLANVMGYMIAIRQQTILRKQFYLFKTERDLKEKLEKSNQDKDKIFSVLAHDLKNPFNSILNNSEFLLKEYKNLDELDMHDSLVILNDSAEKIRVLLDDLLEWARIQLGKLHLKKEKVNIKDLLIKNLEMFDQRTFEKGIVLKSLVDHDMFVYGDENILSTILRNLISNAIKFTGRNGIIYINARIKDNNFELTVKDTGVGMDKDKVNRLFSTQSDDFSNPGTENETGSGIGLYICRELVLLHGGKIDVKSEPGKGSSFKIVIPQ